MESKKIRKSEAKNTLCGNFDIQEMRNNIIAYMGQNKLTVQALSENAGIPYSTLNNLLHNDMHDCKLSTVTALAKAMGVSIDELVSAHILESETYRNIEICRDLPQFRVDFIRWFIHHQEVLEKLSENGERFISVQCTRPTNDKIIKITNNFRMIDTSKCGLSDDIFAVSNWGLRLNCQCYYPIYDGNDIILIANNRNPLSGEHCVVTVKDSLFIVECRYNSDKLLEFYSIRDGKYRTNINKVSELIGYITAVVPDTSVDGNR